MSDQFDDSPRKKGFHLRMPPDLRARVEKSREVSGRSLNAELVALIERGLATPDTDVVGTMRELTEAVEELTRRLGKK